MNTAGEIHMLAPGLEVVIAAVKAGYEGDVAMSVHAKNGRLKIVMGGRTVARGRTLMQLRASILERAQRERDGA